MPWSIIDSTPVVNPGSFRMSKWEEKISDATSDSRSPTCACISSN